VKWPDTNLDLYVSFIDGRPDIRTIALTPHLFAGWWPWDFDCERSWKYNGAIEACVDERLGLNSDAANRDS